MKIYKDLANLLEVDNVQDTDILSEFDCWDSLTILSIIALASESYEKTLTARSISDSETIGGLVALFK